jgi:hypothetical protein
MHKGQRLSDISSSYLDWAIRTCEDPAWPESLKDDMRDELARRRRARTQGAAGVPLLLIKCWHRAVIKKHENLPQFCKRFEKALALLEEMAGVTI